MKLPVLSFQRALLALALSGLVPLRGATNVLLWDAPVRSETPANSSERAQWKQVPSDLFALEKEPAKASSDPGYYGREYVFEGDPVVENSHFVALFRAGRETVEFYSRQNKRLMNIRPLAPQKPVRFQIIRNGGDEIVLDAVYPDEQTTARFTFGKDEIVSVQTSQNLRGVAVTAPIEYAVAPGFVGDDLIFDENTAETPEVTLPAENVLLGLLKGEEQMLVVTWPNAKVPVRAQFKESPSVEIESAGEPVFVAALSAAGIWHREPLNSSFLEKDVALKWKPPFPAKWQTQLLEGDTPTTYPFREHKGTVWRGVPGSYNYPAWFDDGTAYLHLGKKVPPKGNSVIYFLEPSNTPPEVLTPVDVLKATLGRVAAASIVDVAGRKLRTHHGSSGSGVHRACTCGYTEAIQAVFEKGEEVDRKGYVNQSVADMIYFVERHLARIDEYRAFAEATSSFLRSQAEANPGFKDYAADLDALVQQIPQEYENQRENMRSLAHAHELSQQTLALCQKKDARNLSAYMELLKAWRAMGGAQDYVVAQYHTVTRKLFQQAGYLAASDPKLCELSREIRRRCRDVLRNPDGYEIWPNN